MFLLILIFVLSASSYFILSKYKPKLNKRFYQVDEVYPFLSNIHEFNKQIEQEVINVVLNQDKWLDWPERNLYEESTHSWKIYPFYVFGVWVNQNCESCPILTKFLKSIKGLKTASLSRLTPGTKLVPHQGYASHSNYVLRCHFPIILPKKKKSSKMYVADNYESKFESKSYQKFKWIIFDDAKVHYSENYGESERVVLLLDIARPDFVEVGKSDEEDTAELEELIKYFTNN